MFFLGCCLFGSFTSVAVNKLDVIAEVNRALPRSLGMARGSHTFSPHLFEVFFVQICSIKTRVFGCFWMFYEIDEHIQVGKCVCNTSTSINQILPKYIRIYTSAYHHSFFCQNFQRRSQVSTDQFGACFLIPRHRGPPPEKVFGPQKYRCLGNIVI